MRDDCWAVLGIEPVEDRNAIRKAYAAKLKGIDPEADPQAFIALREAMEDALDWLRWQQFDAEEERRLVLAEEGVEPPDVHPVHAELPLPPVAPAPPAGPWQGADGSGQPRPVDERALDELEAMLFGGDPEVFPDPAVLQAVVRHILNDPAMAQVDQAERVGQWLASVIAAAIPRSDPVVGMVADHFGWSSENSSWNSDPNVDFVAARHEGLLLLDRLADPEHDWHEAYLELTSDSPELGWSWRLSKSAVKTLLEFIRANAPEAEGGLNPYRVSLWENKLYGSGEAGYSGFAFSGWTIAIIVILAAVRIFVAAGDSRSTQPPPPATYVREPAVPPPLTVTTTPPLEAPSPPVGKAEQLNRFERALRDDGGKSGLPAAERDRLLRAIEAEQDRLSEPPPQKR